VLTAGLAAGEAQLRTVLEVKLGSPAGQLRAAPVQLGAGSPRGFVVVYGPDFDVDPWHEMFFYAKGGLSVAVVTAEGGLLWKRELGRGIVPGMWFVPVLPFDLDGDGADELWFVNNLDEEHPLSLSGRRLERLDARTGKTTGQWPWTPPEGSQSISHTYRFFILGGMVKGAPVLVTAQGTYGNMALQAWNPDMKRRWERKIPAGPGPRGSHMSPVIDLNGDGVEEILWGERLIEMDRGSEIFCADCDRYNGHSDVIQPFLDWATGRWRIYTCRESDPKATPRVITYDASGRRIWGQIEKGHIDMGWIANLGPAGRRTAMATRIQAKRLGPDGRFHDGNEEFAFDPDTGEPVKLPFSTYRTLPVDVDGDGRHELVRGSPGGDGEVLDGNGKTLARLGGTTALLSKFLDLPGEQILSYYPDGTLRVWADPNARDSEAAKKRYAHPFYRANQRLTSSGANFINLGGL
jgi:hypothetical protein